jgi:hypothetical protein
MTHRQLRLALLAGVLLVAALTAAFLHYFERVEEVVDVGYQGPARLNRFLAAERLFDQIGVPARSVFGSWEIPPAQQTLVLLNPHRALTEAQATEILDWVEKGGNLVAVLSDAPSLDPLMTEFAVGAIDVEPEPHSEKAEKTEKKDAEKTEQETAGDDKAEDFNPEETLKVAWQGDQAHYRVKVRGYRRLTPPEKEDDPEVVAGSKRGTFLLRYGHGNGHVTFLSEAEFLTNELIGQADHARFAWALMQGCDAKGAPSAPVLGILLVVRDEAPSLFALLGRHAWTLLVSGALLIAAWVRLSGSRLGPILPDPPRDRRSLLEHVEATGDFLWKSGRAQDLVRSTRQALLRRVDLRQPTWAKLPSRDLTQRLAANARIAQPQVEQALYGQVQGDPAAFISMIQTLETVRRSL